MGNCGSTPGASVMQAPQEPMQKPLPNIRTPAAGSEDEPDTPVIYGTPPQRLPTLMLSPRTTHTGGGAGVTAKGEASFGVVQARTDGHPGAASWANADSETPVTPLPVPDPGQESASADREPLPAVPGRNPAIDAIKQLALDLWSSASLQALEGLIRAPVPELRLHFEAFLREESGLESLQFVQEVDALLAGANLRARPGHASLAPLSGVESNAVTLCAAAATQTGEEANDGLLLHTEATAAEIAALPAAATPPVSLPPSQPPPQPLSLSAQHAASLAAVDTARALSIFRRYICDDTAGDKQVNVSSHLSTARPEGREVIRVLLRARKEVVKMMSLDGFPRFLKSHRYGMMMTEADKRALAYAVEQVRGKSSAEVRYQASALVNEFIDARGLGNVADRSGRWLEVLKAAAEHIPACIVIADMLLPNAPIIFANQAFCETVRYPLQEVLGHNCRFLQGPQSEPESVRTLRDAIMNGEEVYSEMTNYKKDGTVFRNFLYMKPIFMDFPLSTDTCTLGEQDLSPRASAHRSAAANNADHHGSGTDADSDNEGTKKSTRSHKSSARDVVRKVRYYLSVQYEIVDDSTVVARLFQYQALQRMIPGLIVMY